MSLKVEHAISINATPDIIWKVFEQVEQWPRWDPQAVQSARWLSGEPWAKGSKIELKLTKPMPMTLVPELVEVSAPVFVHLKGNSTGVTADQYYIFKWDAQTNTTELRTLQEFSGMPIAMFGDQARGPILRGIEHMFQRVKSEAENLIQGTEMPTA